MKKGTHSNPKTIDTISAMRILRELKEKASMEKDGKVHVREIRKGHVGKIIEKY